MRVLHVDDSYDDRVLTQMKLEKLSAAIRMSGAESVDAALFMLEHNEYDCILSDYQMPGKDGALLLKTLRDKGINIPFIFYTGQGNEELAVEVFRAGADDYFTKDIGLAHYERLFNSIEKIVKYYKQYLERQEESKALERSQRRLMKSQRLARLSNWEWDFRTDRFYCSDEFFNILAADKENYRTDKSRILNHFPDGERIRFKKDVMSVMRGAEINQKEYQVVDASGEELVLLVSMAPVKDPENDIVIRVEGVVQDVTLRKEVEKEVRTNKEKLYQAHSLGKFGSWEIDIKKNSVWLSENSKEILNIRKDGKVIRPMQVRNLTAPEYYSTVDKAMADLLAGKEPYNIQFEIQEKKSGERKFLHSIGKADFDENGEAVRVFGTIQDITYLKDLEKKQADHYRRIQKVFLASGIPAAEIEADGSIIKQNSNFINVFRSGDVNNIFTIMPEIEEQLKGIEKSNGYCSFETKAYNSKNYHVNIIGSNLNFGIKPGILILVSTNNKQGDIVPGLPASEVDFAILKDQLPVGLYRTTSDGLYLYANETLAHILGCKDVEELKKHNARDFYLDVFDRQKKLNDWIVRDGLATIETKLKTLQGEVIWVKETGVVFLDDNGSIEHILGMIQDITDNKHSEFVQNTMYKIASLANKSGDIYDLFSAIHLHLSKVIDTTNFYIALHEGGDNYFFPYVVDVNDKTLNDRLVIKKGLTSHVLNTGRPLLVDQEEINLMAEQGKIEIIGSPAACWMGVPLYSENKVIGVMAVQNYHDQKKYTREDLDILTFISGQVANAIERKITEKTLMSQRDELAMANKELESFSYTVSHDLRAPLRHITGYCSLLADCLQPNKDSDESRYFRGILDSAERMDSLITDILKLTRSTSQEINSGSIDLSKICQVVVKAYQSGSETNTINIEIEPGMKAWGDSRMIQIVMENLLGNAIKFTGKQENPEIKIGSEIIDGMLTFYVMDNGAGFDSSKAEEIFHPFKRCHSSKEFSGTGIGLATVSKIIQRHGGRIWAKSKKGAGATFYLQLPSQHERSFTSKQ